MRLLMSDQNSGVSLSLIVHHPIKKPRSMPKAGDEVFSFA
jgi:hypothetical protein